MISHGRRMLHCKLGGNIMNKKKVLKALGTTGLIAGGFFVGTFTVYYFNLDMKMTAMMQPLLEKWYDRVERDNHL